MSPWLLIALLTNLVYWIAFVYLAYRNRPTVPAAALGVMHMLVTAALSVAPSRSFFDPDYPGFGLGILHFEKRAATLPTALLLLWALSSALILAARGRGKALWIVAIGDSLLALNQLLGLMQSGSDNVIQFGEYLTIRGLQALLLMGILFVGGPALSAWWTARNARRTMA